MRYRRARAEGGTFFFTVNLADRDADTLVRHIDALRESMAAVKAAHPFSLVAMVVLPEHLHAIWRLPEGDTDYPMRWSLLKAGFSRRVGRDRCISPRHVKEYECINSSHAKEYECINSSHIKGYERIGPSHVEGYERIGLRQVKKRECINPSRMARRERGFWQRRYWEHQIRNDDDLARHVDYIHFNPVKHGWVSRAVDWPYSTLHGYIARGMMPRDWGGCESRETGGYGER